MSASESLWKGKALSEDDNKNRMGKEESLGCLLLLAIAIICFTIYKCVELMVS